MTRRELARLTRALLPYMSSAKAAYVLGILAGLEMSGAPHDVRLIAGMVARHQTIPRNLQVLIEAAMTKDAGIGVAE